jgi:hypothetical protein
MAQVFSFFHGVVQKEFSGLVSTHRFVPLTSLTISLVLDSIVGCYWRGSYLLCV